MSDRPKGFGLTADVAAKRGKMASRPKGFGLTAEINAKIDSKYDATQAQEAIDWIEEIIGEPTGCNGGSPEEFQEGLKDGLHLVKLINIICGAAGKATFKPNTSKMAFKQMENTSNFLLGCESLGISKTDLFQTVALYEGTNIPQVVAGIHALGRKAQSLGLDVPVLGPKESEKNVREFSQEQLNEGKKVIGLQAGSNKGASQSGMSFGATRQIHQ